MNARQIFIHARTPLHAGTGQGTDVIDLPIAREQATGIPYLPGSSLKGALRDACPIQQRTALFGPETANASDQAGAIQITDLRLVLLPVRSLAGTFAYVTSPYILRRCARDAADCGANPPAVPLVAEIDKLLVTEKTALQATTQGDAKAYLEDLDLTIAKQAQTEVAAWAAWLGTQIFAGKKDDIQMLTERLAIVHDDVMTFLLTTALQVTARIRLEEKTKTVAKGGLWYEEALPAETVLSGLLVAMPNSKTGMDGKAIFAAITELVSKPMQLGGKATVGRGLCQITLAQGV